MNNGETPNKVHEEVSLELREPADNAQVVVTARKMARKAGFGQTNEFLIASAVSELTTNIIRYAGQGAVILRIIQGKERSGFEVVALDSGPGIVDIDQAMREHYSGGNGLGLGLPSVKRIMDEFDIVSSPGHGTKVMARKWV